MSKFLKQRKIWARFKKDTRGNFAIIWAVGLSASILAVGSGIDMTTTTRSLSVAQSAADQVALTSAVFYSNNRRVPNSASEGFMDGRVYRGIDAGYTFPNSVSRVRVKAMYDIDNGEVVTEVTGRTSTSFMGAFNKKMKSIPFKTVSTAKFNETELKNPASIVLVLDNSGSMAWDDKEAEGCVWRWNRVSGCRPASDGQARITGLIDSVKGFMDILEGYVGPQNVPGKRVLRTGMIPYDEDVINNRRVNMKWGTINDAKINAMRPDGGTNSAPPIADAWQWMQAENAKHDAETGNDNPLRYMIFMTDGQNSEPKVWLPRSGTDYWRGYQCTRWRRGRCRRWSTIERSSTSMPNIQGTQNWQEGLWESPSDTASMASCSAMKAQGVRVFTIGFALEPGIYAENDRRDRNFREITEEASETAYNLLQECASEPGDFMAAVDVEKLDEAFAMIGASIVQEVIRISD